MNLIISTPANTDVAPNTAPAPGTVTPLPKADIKRIARYQFSLAVQGSRLDMQAYDMDKSLRQECYRTAKGMVRDLEARGIQVTVEG